MREQWLARLAGESPDAASVRASVIETIDWRGDRQYLRDVRTFIDREQSRLGALAMKLGAAGVLTEQERATVAPSIRVRIEDARGIRTSRLPLLLNPASNVTVLP